MELKKENLIRSHMLFRSLLAWTMVRTIYPIFFEVPLRPLKVLTGKITFTVCHLILTSVKKKSRMKKSLDSATLTKVSSIAIFPITIDLCRSSFKNS